MKRVEALPSTSTADPELFPRPDFEAKVFQCFVVGRSVEIMSAILYLALLAGGVYLYDAETFLNSMSPLTGQFSGDTTISAGRASDWVSALNAFTRETAPILVSSVVPKKNFVSQISKSQVSSGISTYTK